jgi:hypothetical protein
MVTIAALNAMGGGCTLTTSTDGLAGGPPIDSSTLDGVAPGDASPTDSAPSSDGGVDAAIPFRCADHSGAAFCSDFETDPFDLGWARRLDSSGSFELVPSRTSRGLRGSVPSRNGSTNLSAGLANTVVLPGGSSFTFSFDVLLDPSIAAAGTFDFGGFAFRDGTFYQADLRLSDGMFSLEEFADAKGSLPALNKSRPLMRGPAAGIWTRVEMRWTFTQTSSHAVVKLDGTTVLDSDTQAYHYAASPELIIGITNTIGSGGAFSIVVDDVLLTTP